jgi:hypothetical protein
MAKRNREQAVRERRALKQEKKQAAAAVRRAKADGTWVEPEVDGEPEVDEETSELGEESTR